MMNLIDYIRFKLNPSEDVLMEMATIDKSVALDKKDRRIAIHGPSSKDKENPHIHIYNADDKPPFNKFNFEISLTDILSKDEINLIKMRDQNKGILKNNRSKCSWNGYYKIKNDFEDWLFSNKVKIPGEWIDNLDAIIYTYNNESYGSNNYILQYMKERGMKVLSNYWNYFNEEDKKEYKECFK